MKIAIGSDHAGFRLKEKIKEFLLSKGYEVLDFGTNSTESTHYPIFAKEVARAVQRKGIRAALCLNEYMARISRRHNNANVLCLGDRVLGEELALSIVSAWLSEDLKVEGIKRDWNSYKR
jgi:ribose 5-phosphate isomerase B